MTSEQQKPFGNPVRPMEYWEAPVQPVEEDEEPPEEVSFQDHGQGGDEAEPPSTLRDPGAPTTKEVEEHNVTHLPFWYWCSACVSGKARDRQHRLQVGGEEKGVPDIVFDYGVLGAEGEDTLATQIARDKRTHMIFAHVVPR